MPSDARMPIGMSLLRILRFLRRGRYRVESDVGEEHDRRAAHDAAPAVVAELAVVFAGMNGCQFAVFTYMKPKPITRSTIATLMNTITLLKFADSLMPITSSVVIRQTSTIAGRLIMPGDSVIRGARAVRRGDRFAGRIDAEQVATRCACRRR